MKIAIRTDASARIGAGHVMRCRTLAGVLRQAGHDVRFVCRDLPGNLIDLTRRDGFVVSVLPPDGEGEAEDAKATLNTLSGESLDWVIVDHYELGQNWERLVRPHVKSVMVVDDLADRQHDADMLLDQNLIADFSSRYTGLVEPKCKLLLGPQFALVRPEFAALRQASLQRRAGWQLRNLLLFMGGGDVFAETQTALEGALASAIDWARLDVVIGAGCPHKDRLQAMLAAHECSVLHVQTDRMASLMAGADIAITGGGGTSWEKCLLGLPSLVAVLSHDQVPIAEALHNAGAQITIGLAADLSASDYKAGLQAVDPRALENMSHAASRICDGDGAQRVVEALQSM